MLLRRRGIAASPGVVTSSSPLGWFGSSMCAWTRAEISHNIADSVDALGSPRTLLDGGPCSHHTYVITH